MATLFCSIQNPLHVVRTKQFSENEKEINRNTSSEYLKTLEHKQTNKDIKTELCAFLNR